MNCNIHLSTKVNSFIFLVCLEFIDASTQSNNERKLDEYKKGRFINSEFISGSVGTLKEQNNIYSVIKPDNLRFKYGEHTVFRSVFAKLILNMKHYE